MVVVHVCEVGVVVVGVGWWLCWWLHNYKAVSWRRNPGNIPSLFTEQMDELLVKEYVESELGS